MLKRKNLTGSHLYAGFKATSLLWTGKNSLWVLEKLKWVNKLLFQ